MTEDFSDAIKYFVSEVRIDTLGNIIAHKPGVGKSIMLIAHHDVVRLMVSYILKFPTPVFIMFQSNNGCCNPSVFRRFLFVKNTLIPALLLIQVLPRLGVC